MEWNLTITELSLTLFSVAIILIAIYVIWQKWRKRKLHFENQYLLLQQNLIKEHHELLEEQLRATSKSRHDLANHLQTIEDLTSAYGEDQSFSFYTDTLKGFHNKLKRVIYCNNIVINSVIHNKVRACELENIPVTVELQAFDQGNIPEIDMLSILYNVFDNAIEACRKVEKGHGYIEISSIQVANRLVIKVRNTMPSHSVKEKEGRLLTTKKNKYRHGFGMQIVEETVQKYNGLMVVSTEEDMFELVLTMENR